MGAFLQEINNAEPGSSISNVNMQITAPGQRIKAAAHRGWT